MKITYRKKNDEGVIVTTTVHTLKREQLYDLVTKKIMNGVLKDCLVEYNSWKKEQDELLYNGPVELAPLSILPPEPDTNQK